MWSILENVPCALEKKVYSSAFGWNVLKISVRSNSSNVSFKTCVSLLIFYFDDLSMGVNGVLKPPTIIVLQSNFFLGLLVFVYVLRCSYVGCIDIYNCSKAVIKRNFASFRSRPNLATRSSTR